MATKLTIKTHSTYQDLVVDSTAYDKVKTESYIEGSEDTVKWRLEQMCKHLLAEGFSMEIVNKYVRYDGEVYEIEEE